MLLIVLVTILEYSAQTQLAIIIIHIISNLNRLKHLDVVAFLQERVNKNAESKTEQPLDAGVYSACLNSVWLKYTIVVGHE